MAAMTCTTVYVGNLNFKTTSEDLVNFFEGAEIGNVVNVDLKKHAADGQSKGWALVDFASAEDASNRADQLNGALLDDRLLTIRLDRKSLPMNGGNFGGMGYNSGGAVGRGNGGVVKDFAPSNWVYVGNLSLGGGRRGAARRLCHVQPNLGHGGLRARWALSWVWDR